MSLTAAEEIEYIRLADQEERERLSPKLEAIKTTDKNIVIVQGGRGAGAKTWGVASAIVQLCQYEMHRVVCLREVQKSLEESVYQTIVDTIERLQYPGWHITDEYIENTRSKAHFIFRGLRDIRAAHQVKGLERYDIGWLEEASVISEESINMFMPTLVRNPDWWLFITYNPETDFDSVTLRFWNSDRPDILKLRVEAGIIDNPWWSDGLQREMELDYARDPDEALHIWGGMPRKQGQNAVMSRAAIRGAMTRQIEAKGGVEIGIDVARFGDDTTVMYKRRGLKTIDRKSWIGQDTVRTAREAWDMANRDPSVEIKVDDTGVGGGVTDNLRDMGAKVTPINFGGSPKDDNLYSTAADEMWFTFPVDEAQIPNDPELMMQLSARLYDYDNKKRRVIESKKKYKERFKKSPDDADALLLCYYQGGSRVKIDDDSRKQMQKRSAKYR